MLFLKYMNKSLFYPNYKNKNNRKSYNKLLVYSLIAFILVTFSYATYRSGLLNLAGLTNNQSSLAGGTAVLKMPASISMSLGSTVDVPIMLTSDAPLVGVDLKIAFPPAQLSLVDVILPNSSPNFKTFLPLDTSNLFNKNKVLTDAKTGTINFSTITSDSSGNLSPGFTGTLDASNPLVTLRFQPLTSTQSSVSFVFTPGSTTDSNAAAQNPPQDILTSVQNATLVASLPSSSPIVATATPIPATPSSIFTISNILATNITVNSTDVTWITSQPGTSLVKYGTNSRSLSFSTLLDTSLTTNHKLSINNLSAGTRYYYQVYSQDNAGLDHSSTIYNFRTKNAKRK
jgi:hypothetical protein